MQILGLQRFGTFGIMLTKSLGKGCTSVSRRIISLFLTFFILISVASGVVQASTETPMKTSKDAIEILKGEEGFSAKPYWDYAQWTVGYGTRCPDDKLEQYKKDGITEAAAEELLQSFLVRFETELHDFMKRTGVKLNQNQFDALLLFSYNCGTAWSYSTTGLLYNAVVKGAKGNELINAFSRWCNAGGQILTSLLRRRLCEANMYLNGQYSRTIPETFGYVLYDPCGGNVSPNVQGYDTSLTASIIPTPTYEGFKFAGWYTQKTGGTKVTVLDATVRNGRLYAHWTDTKGNDITTKPQDGVVVTVSQDGVNIRKGPSTSYASVGKANKGDQLVITETAVGGSFNWGKFEDGWIALKYTDYDAVTAPKQEEPEKPETRTGTVKVSDVLNVRSGPSTGYAIVAQLKNGTKVEILEQKVAGSMVWGKINKGWISLNYVVLDPEKEETSNEPEQTQPPATQPPETQPPQTEPPATKPQEQEPATQSVTGTVKVGDVLRVRSGPSTSTKVVGYLYNGDKVTITEQTTSGSMTWGKTVKGWVSMNYINLDPVKKPETETETKKITGTVKVNDILRVRSGPGTSYAVAGYLKANDKVEILEQKKVGSTVWGKVSKGWISLDYVKLDGQTTSSGSSKPQTVTKTVTADCLRIRGGAGTSYKIVGYLYAGAKVEILETKKVGNTTWGRVAKGWISLDYVK